MLKNSVVKVLPNPNKMTEAAERSSFTSENQAEKTSQKIAQATAIIIPALNPARELVEYIEQLRELGFAPIIVINDGSDGRYASIFERIAKIPGCEVLTHAVNLGKGRPRSTTFWCIIQTCAAL